MDGQRLVYQFVDVPKDVMIDCPMDMKLNGQQQQQQPNGTAHQQQQQAAAGPKFPLSDHNERISALSPRAVSSPPPPPPVAAASQQHSSQLLSAPNSFAPLGGPEAGAQPTTPPMGAARGHLGEPQGIKMEHHNQGEQQHPNEPLGSSPFNVLVGGGQSAAAAAALSIGLNHIVGSQLAANGAPPGNQNPASNQSGELAGSTGANSNSNGSNSSSTGGGGNNNHPNGTGAPFGAHLHGHHPHNHHHHMHHQVHHLANV